MRVVVQRVSRAAVRRIDVEPVQEERIGAGLLVLAGFRRSDDDGVLRWMAEKCTGLRIFADASGAMNCSLEEVGGALLVVPNFTLYGDARKGRRPSFTLFSVIKALGLLEVAAALFAAFVGRLRQGPVPVRTGFFQTSMQVESVNDGPVTLWIEREAGAGSGSGSE